MRTDELLPDDDELCAAGRIQEARCVSCCPTRRLRGRTRDGGCELSHTQDRMSRSLVRQKTGYQRRAAERHSDTSCRLIDDEPRPDATPSSSSSPSPSLPPTWLRPALSVLHSSVFPRIDIINLATSHINQRNAPKIPDSSLISSPPTTFEVR